MSTTRPVRHMAKSRPALEGTEVHLRRAFGYNQAPLVTRF